MARTLCFRVPLGEIIGPGPPLISRSTKVSSQRLVSGLSRSRVAGVLGLGTGYEWGSINASNALGNASENANGWEFLTLQAGGDIRLASALNGPLAAHTFAVRRQRAPAPE
jgi:hypothetical protein